MARGMCMADDVDPDSIVDKNGRAPEAAWCAYRERARRELALERAGAGESDQVKE
jgi:hypothetical protein